MTPTTDPVYHRWAREMAAHGHFPAPLLAAYYTACQTGEPLDTAQVVAALGCGAREAETWLAATQVLLIPADHYRALFAAEDAAADVRTRRMEYVTNVKATSEQLAAIDHQISTLKTYGLLSEACQGEVEPKIAALDHEREALLRHQSRDVPVMEEVLRQEEADVRMRLQTAQEALSDAFASQVAQRQAEWTDAVLERLQPVLELLSTVASINEAWALLQEDPRLHGTNAMRQAVQRRLQQG